MATFPANISRGRIQLMLRHPYLASATARLKFRMVEEEWCATMATDGFNIFVNPAFADTLSGDEIVGVMAHEVMHCILGHADRRGIRAQDQWNIAIDLATNLILTDSGVTLPKGGLLDWSYRGMTAEDIYNHLSKNPSTLKKLSASRGKMKLSDIHLSPTDLKGQWARGDDHPSEAERRRLRKSWRDEIKSKIPGKVSGDYSDEIKMSGKQEIDWRGYLSHFMTGLRRDDYRLFPPNKKHLWRGIYLPSFGSPGPDHIVVAIDTSGSMGREELGKILTEIDAARQIAECKLTVIQCDSRIKSVETLEAWELASANFGKKRMRGTGGTSLIPPFEWIEKYVKEGAPVPDALIYMTDGYGVAPKDDPLYPCLWVVPETGSMEFPFGNVIQVHVAT
jgi:predicted metal-dependent peptidase